MKPERWKGSPNINKPKQFVCVFRFFSHDSVNEALLIKMYFPKLRDAPLSDDLLIPLHHAI